MPEYQIFLRAACVLLIFFAGAGNALAQNQHSTWNSANLDVMEQPESTMVNDYFEKRAEKLTSDALDKLPAAQFMDRGSKIRQDYAEHLMMPKNYAAPEVQHIGDLEIDGIVVEKQLIRTRDGIYSPALVYRPSLDSPKRSPAMLMLPGHGDPGWASSVQSRCLSFARQGYVVLFVEPYGQMERGEDYKWNEYHGSMSSAYLMTVGQSLLGCIMADHVSEITYLSSREDVDPEQVVVGGVSMGGSHTLWIMALDTRLKAACAVSAAAVHQSVFAMRHHCLCDTVQAGIEVLPDEFLRSLCAPRAYMNIFPSTERPAPANIQRDYANGKVSFEDMASKYGLTDQQIDQLAPYARKVYALAGAADKYKMVVVEGPHDFTKTMRELAAGWYAFALGKSRAVTALPEPELHPFSNKEARPMLDFWNITGPPSDALNPTQYLQKLTLEKVNKLSKLTPDKATLTSLRIKLKKLLLVDLNTSNCTSSTVGTVSIEGRKVRKIVVKSELGISLPLLLIEPARKSARMQLILTSSGKKSVLESDWFTNNLKKDTWIAILEPRGTGETTSVRSVGAYTGIKDIDLNIAAIKSGQTLAGLWTLDTLAAIKAAKKVVGRNAVINIRGERECGYVAMLAGVFSKDISSVETVDMLSSYYSAKGYGNPYAYGNELGKPAPERKLGGWGSMLAAVPYILDTADISQIAALVSPKPLTIGSARYADDTVLTKKEALEAFAWTSKAYAMQQSESGLRIEQ